MAFRTCSGDTSTTFDWIISPVELKPFDDTVVHCMGVALDEFFLGRVDKNSGLDAGQRMADMLAMHVHLSLADLYVIARTERQQLAMDSVVAEVEERHAVPRQLIPLRTVEVAK